MRMWSDRHVRQRGALSALELGKRRLRRLRRRHLAAAEASRRAAHRHLRRHELRERRRAREASASGWVSGKSATGGWPARSAERARRGRVQKA